MSPSMLSSARRAAAKFLQNLSFWAAWMKLWMTRSKNRAKRIRQAMVMHKGTVMPARSRQANCGVGRRGDWGIGTWAASEREGGVPG